MGAGYKINYNSTDDLLWVPHDGFKKFAQAELVKLYNSSCKLIEQDKSLIAVMKNFFSDIVCLQEKGQKAPIRYIHFFFLESSIITDSNEIQINAFSKESYMDRQESMTIWHPEFIMRHHLESVKSVDQMARQRVRGYCHKDYMDLKHWSYNMYNMYLLGYLFRNIGEVIDSDEYKAINKEEDIQIVFGGYMDKGVQLWPLGEDYKKGEY